MGIIHWIQSWQNPILTLMFKCITDLGNEGFYVFLLPMLYWTWNKHAMRRLVVLFLPSIFIAVLLKQLLHSPRPEGVAMIKADGFSFPSGHAMGSTIVWGYIAFYIGKRVFTVIACVAIFLISLSRLYLGVHWLADVVGGISLGLLILLFFRKIEFRASEFCKRQAWTTLIALLVAIAYIVCAAYPVSESFIVMGLLVGMGTGMIVERHWVRFSVTGSQWVRCGRALLGSAGTFFIWWWLRDLLPADNFATALSYALTGFWMMGLAPMLFTWFRLSVCEASL